MTSFEKAELLKTTIEHLYSKEGRSISYIGKLLEINRKTLSEKIKEWKLPEAEPRHHFTPSVQKFLNKNRNLIKSRLDHDISITQIAKELKVERGLLQKTIIPNDPVLNKAREDYINRLHAQANERKEDFMEKSRLDYDIVDLPGEIWKPILGWDGYMVSNKARIKHLAKRYGKYHLVKTFPNSNNGRIYVMLQKDNIKKNIQLANVVAHAFVEGYDETHNTVNHEDGDVGNNDATNLTWQTQSDNNTHAYRKLNRSKVNKKKYQFSKIVYQHKYEFKTVAALARFIGKSETQTRRYLDEPDKHEIELIK